MKEGKLHGTVTECSTVILNKMLCYETALLPREGLAVDGREFTASSHKGRKHWWGVRDYLWVIHFLERWLDD